MAKIPSNLENDDLLLVNRGSDSYNATIDTTSDKVIENLTIFDTQGSGSPYEPANSVASSWNKGQLWYNQTNGLMYTFKDPYWETVGGTDINSSSPGEPQSGDFYVNESSNELFFRNKANNRWMGVPYISGLTELP
jgi:hypothetical protein